LLGCVHDVWSPSGPQVQPWKTHPITPMLGLATIVDDSRWGRSAIGQPDTAVRSRWRCCYLAGWAMVSSTAAVARIRMSFSPGATSTP
jgi:hypothetical protein